jgi:hypothetical protein
MKSSDTETGFGPEGEGAPRAEKRRPAEEFLTDFFRSEKCRVRRVDKRVTEVALNPELASEFHRDRLLLCFDKRTLEQHPEAELATAGSRVYDQVLQLCRRGGRFSVQYARLEHPWRGFEALPEPVRFVNATPRVAASDPQYHAVVLFNFSVSYRSVAVSDEIVSLGYDAYFQRGAADVDFYLPHWLDFAAKKPLELRCVEPPPVGEFFPGVCRALDLRIRRKVQRIKRQSRRLLQQEIQSIEGYYRQLIAEEKANRERRGRLPRRAQEEGGDRIELYQLDWKRRIAEETKHYEPSVVIGLFSVGKVYVPRSILRLTLGSEGPAGDRRLAMNHATGRVEGLACELCDTEMSAVYRAEDGRLLCEGCHQDWPAEAGATPGTGSRRAGRDDDGRE